LALAPRVFTKAFNVIDCRFDKYTFSELICLIKADMIRRSENPARFLLPSVAASELCLHPSWCEGFA
jgi:hypothetical protein